MSQKLVRFGYVEVEFTQDCLLGPAGSCIRGHSFHYSTMSGVDELTSSYRVTYSISGKEEAEGFGVAGMNVLASYVHLHFGANPDVAQHFIDAAVAAR